MYSVKTLDGTRTYHVKPDPNGGYAVEYRGVKNPDNRQPRWIDVSWHPHRDEAAAHLRRLVANHNFYGR